MRTPLVLVVRWPADGGGPGVIEFANGDVEAAREAAFRVKRSYPRHEVGFYRLEGAVKLETIATIEAPEVMP